MGKIALSQNMSLDGVIQSQSSPRTVAFQGGSVSVEETTYFGGSRRLSHALIGMGLVDDLRLLVYPVVLGAGDRLFGETQDKIALRLVESRPSGGGVVKMIYEPAKADG
jgi:dihydrofolate reductase